MIHDETEASVRRLKPEQVVSATQDIRVLTVGIYRLYCLDGANKVASADWIEADDDALAIEIAKRAHDGYECELWQRQRLVVRLDLRRRR